MKFFAALILSVLPLSAATLHVATTGNDTTGDGSSVAPYRTITKAKTAAITGDTVSVASGTYTESVQTGAAGVKYYGTNATTTAFRISHANTEIHGFTLTGAQNAGNTWGASIRVEVAGDGLVVSNCFFGPGVFSVHTNASTVIDYTAGTLTDTNVDWAARGFVVSGKCYAGGVTDTNSQYHYVNIGKIWTITNISGSTIYLDGAWEAETNTTTWIPVYASLSDAYGVPPIEFVVSAGVGACNSSILGNTFSNIWACPIILYGTNNLIAWNTFTKLNSYHLIKPYGSENIIRSNLWYNCPNEVINYSSFEFAHHPAGGIKYYDFVAGGIHATLPNSTNIYFDHNWIEDIYQPIAQIGEASWLSSGFYVRSNVFVGAGSAWSGGRNGLQFIGNTFYRAGYDGSSVSIYSGGNSALAQLTNFAILKNVFVDSGNHSITNNEIGYSVNYVYQPVIASNLIAGPEVLRWQGSSSWTETNGVNGGDPLFRNAANPRGPDGLPFTEDDGLRPLPHSQIALNGLGALAAIGSEPTAYFTLSNSVGWLDVTGESFDTNWINLAPFERLDFSRPYGTADPIGTVPAEVTFDARNAISGTWSGTNWIGIKQFTWDFGDGSVIRTKQPFITHTWLWPGEFTVTLTIQNSTNGTASISKPFRILPSTTNFTANVYHVKTNGNDTTGTGTFDNPWATIAKAVATVTNGDYVAVHQGDYGAWIDVNRNVAYETNRITFIGYGAKTWGAQFRYSDYTWDGFAMNFGSGTTLAALYVYQAADRIWLRNNTIYDTPQGKGGVYVANSGDPNPFLASGYGRIENNFFTNVGYIQINIQNGSNWVVRANQAWNSWSEGDFIRPVGLGCHIYDNYCTNLSNGGTGGHPDFFQLPNQATDEIWRWFKDIIIERNHVVGAPNGFTNDAAICQLESGSFADSRWTNIIVRNNIFERVRGSASLSVDGVKFYNNLFYQTPRASGVVTTGGGTRGSCYGTMFTNNIFYGSGLTDANTTGWYYNGLADGQGTETNTTVFADFNFVAGTNGTAKRTAPPDENYYWGANGMEANGINGGTPLFLDEASGDFRLHPDSTILISDGTDLSVEGFTDDFYGNTRSSWSIGPLDVGGAYTPPPQPEPTPGGKGRWRGGGRKTIRGFIR